MKSSSSLSLVFLSVSCCRLNYLHSVSESVRVSGNTACVDMYERSLRTGSRETPAVSPPHTPAKRRRTTESQYIYTQVKQCWFSFCCTLLTVVCVWVGSVGSGLDAPALTSTVIQSRVGHGHQQTQPPSTEVSSDQLSEDDFIEG